MNKMTLYELNSMVRRMLDEGIPDEVWVSAELSEVHANAASGHCYVELVQKNEKKGTLMAKARATIWAGVYALLKPYFEQETGQHFAAGIQVLVRVSVEFHELYGYSLSIKDIEPSYTVGELVRNRREILRRLQEEGVLDMNRELEWPVPAQRVAVISSATAAGYGDFCDQLLHNAYGLVFYPCLFPAIMQGAEMEESIIAALNRIAVERERWDVVVLIRGGGATSDLSGFDTYDLAVNCAQFPLPIATGIGHERDDTVIDRVAHTRVKTPTAAAELLIESLREQADGVEDMARRAVNAAVERMQDEKHRMELTAARLPMMAALNLQKWRHRIEMWEQTVRNASPERILKRGYSLTLKEGRAVTDAETLKEGDRLTTCLRSGLFTSMVTTVNKKRNEKKDDLRRSGEETGVVGIADRK